MTDKEQIIIDGVFINVCLVSEKCKEFETCKIKNILRQLARKTAECKEREQDAENWVYKAGLATGKASRYLKALEEIEEILDNGTANININAAHLVHQHYLSRFCDIRNIISNAKAITT